MMTAQTQHTANGLDFDAALKRGLDFVFAFSALIVLSPVFVVIALTVVSTSPGGALFRQQRVGRNGTLFWLYKFRSMRIQRTGNREQEIKKDQITVTASGDNRITAIGRVLRRFKLDELPQFWNVLKGDMSLVGPRPEVPRYVAHYTEEQRAVLRVRPGITGAAQLEYRDEEKLLAERDDVEAFYLTHILPAKLAIDLRYVRERSFGGDLRLLLRTLRAIMT